MKTYTVSNITVWSSKGKEIFPCMEKTIPTGSIVRRKGSEEFVTLATDHKWVKNVNKQSECTNTANWVECNWDIEKL